LLLQLDTNDWPVSFLGCLYAGVVPVAVNTLLTPDDYAYMLEHSDAAAVLVSGALAARRSPAAMATKAPAHEVRRFRLQPVGCPARRRDRPGIQAIAAASPWPPAVPHRRRTDHAFWLYSSGSTGRPKGTVHSMPTRGGRPSCSARPCSASPRAMCVSRPPSCTSPMAWATR
jgi:benzoate-CoA ligase